MQNTQTSQIFNSLGPVNGKLHGNAARTFFLKSNLPTHSLKEIWDKSDRDKDGQLTLEEFDTAVKLIQAYRRGTNIAIVNSVRPETQQTIPRNPPLASTDWSSFSADGRHSSPVKAGSSHGSLPASISNEMWVVDLNAKKRYLAMFNRLDSKRTGSVAGAIMRQEFMKSVLPLPTLSLIWNLSDITKTGSLSSDEFCLAMYLIENAQRGKDPPPALTPALVPPQYRHVIVKEISSGAGSNTATFSKATFENKKMENFNKGEQELERRRLEVKEKERKALEAKEADLLAMQELERQRAELQARRALEFQRQKTRSLEEAARKQQVEDEVKNTLYRNKMETWATQRKQQLEVQLERLRELTTGLRTRKFLLDKELSDLESRCNKTKNTLESFRDEKTLALLEIENLKQYKSDIINEVSSARMAVESSQSELATVTNDKLRLSQQLRARRNPEEVLMSILEDQEKAKQSLISLKSEYTQISSKTEKCQNEYKNVLVAQEDINERLAEKETEILSKRSLLTSLEQAKMEQGKQEESAKRRREEEEKEEKEKKDQMEENLKRIEDSVKNSESKREQAQTHKIQQEREEFEKFNEFLSHKSEEADRNIQTAAVAAQLATEAVYTQRSRLKKLVEQERKRHTSETESFYERATGSIKRGTVLPRVPSTDNLICLDTPPRPNIKQNYTKDLESVLMMSSPSNTAQNSLYIEPKHWGKTATTQQRGDARLSPSPVHAQQRDSMVVKQSAVEEYEEHSIYMNVDPEGILNKRAPVQSPDQRTPVQSPDQFYDAHSSVVEFQEDEHIYALTSDVVKREVLFEVEALEDHIGGDGELSFDKGARLKVYENQGDNYFGARDENTGLIPVNLVEKCEWIYSEIPHTRVAVALYDFHTDVAGDLCFDVGAVVSVIEELGEWYRGQVDDTEGIFPGNFVKFRDEEQEDLQPPPSSLLPPQDIKPISTAHVTENYHTEDVGLSVGDEVSILTQPDPDNVYIQNSCGRRAWIKTSLLKMKEHMHPAPIGAERIPASLHCYSLYSYSAQNTDELSFKANDIITITEQSDPSWWIGKLGSQVGVLPSNYVAQINDQTTWETVKAWSANISPSEDERTRQEAIHELISTEKTYIDDLLLVIEVFYNPLCSVASEEELVQVFVNWQQLILCNARLFRALYNNSDANSFETVGAVILEEIDSLVGPYTKFCSSQRQAMVTLQEHTTPMFKAKENECAQSPKVGKLPLSTFLLKPMQRITKYPLLIKKIIQNTRDTHPDCQALKDSLARTEYLLISVNEAVRATTRLESLQRVFVKCLADDLGERVVLNAATNCLGPRKLIHFGSVSKSKGGKELFAVLFNDMFWLARLDRGRYGNKPIDLDARDFDVIKFEQYREPFLLYNINLLESIKNSVDSIQFAHNDKNYTFYCATPKECSELSDHLQSAIRHATLLYQSHNRNSIPDPTVSGQATFTIRVVEGLDLSLPPDEKPTSVFVQAALNGHIQRTLTGGPKWEHTMHFVIQDVTCDKVNLTVYKENVFSPNVPLGKFDLSLQKLIKSGGIGPWNKRLILTDTASGMVNVSISLRYHGNR